MSVRIKAVVDKFVRELKEALDADDGETVDTFSNSRLKCD